MDEPIKTEVEIKETPKSIVEKAAEMLNDDGTLKTEEKKPVEKKEEKKEEAEKRDDELSDEDKVLAINLLKSLRDPEQAPGVIAWFAEKGGFTKQEQKDIKEAVKDLKDGTAKEQKEAKDEIVALFEDQFGEEFAGKFAPLLKKAIDKGVEERTKDIKQTFQDREIKEATDKATLVLSDIGKQFYEKDGIPAEVRSEMNKLMDQYKPAKDQTVEDYLNDIHSLAATKKGGSLKPIDRTKQEKIDRNKNDISGKLNTGRQPVPDKESVELSTVKNAKDAVRLAEEQLKDLFK